MAASPNPQPVSPRPARHHHHRPPEVPPTEVLFSFAAAGWLQMYHFGAGKALQDSGLAAPEHVAKPFANTDNRVRFAGSSAGALAASALVVGADFNALKEYACACAVDCRSTLLGAFNIRHYVRRGVELFATGAFREAAQKCRQQRLAAIAELKARSGRNRRARRGRKPAAEKVDEIVAANVDQEEGAASPLEESDGSDAGDSGYSSDSSRNQEVAERDLGSLITDVDDISKVMAERLEVYATTLPFLREHRFTKFDAVEDLDEALTASCLLVPLAGMPLRLRQCGTWVLDGGAAAFQPRNGQKGVVTVSAMYFASADVKPSVFIPIWWGLYPPNDVQYRALFELGYNDCVDGLLRKRLISPTDYDRLRSTFSQSAAQATVPRRGVLALARDLAAFMFFMFFLRPVGLVMIYFEMFLVLFVGAAVALLHDILPTGFPLISLFMGPRSSRRREGTRLAAWKDVYLAVRNLISMRVPLHLIVGSRIPVNARRLERYSRVYRALRPFLG